MRLIELIVALTIFAAVITMSMEGMVAVRAYADLERAERMLEIEGKTALDRMGTDFVNCAWTPTTATPTTNLSTFPRVWKANDTARSSANPPSFPYGDAISFYKLRTEAEIATGSPTALRTDNVAFDDFSATNVPVRMSQATSARPISSLILNGGWADSTTTVVPPITSVVWEAAHADNAASTSTPSVNYNANQNLATLRQYRFTVIPDSQTGMGILVKQWRNAGSTVDTDWPAAVIGNNATEICRDVVTISFDSYLTESDEALAKLNVYQVRVDLMLAAADRAGGQVVLSNTSNRGSSVVTDGTGGTGASRRFSSTFTLRSVTDPTL